VSADRGHPMKRREFVLMLSAAMTAARAVAQQKTMLAVGWLNMLSPPANLGDLGRGPIHQGLRETGFVEGQNMMSEYRWAEGHYDRLPALAADLVSRKVDLIIANSTPSRTSGQKRNLDDSDRLHQRRRPGRDRSRRQSRPPGRQCHGLYQYCHRADAQAGRAGYRVGSSAQGGRSIGQPEQCEC
jgi:hypothetical protein